MPSTYRAYKNEIFFLQNAGSGDETVERGQIQNGGLWPDHSWNAQQAHSDAHAQGRDKEDGAGDIFPETGRNREHGDDADSA